MKTKNLQQLIAIDLFGCARAWVTLEIKRTRVNEVLQRVKIIRRVEGVADFGKQKFFWREGSGAPENMRQGLPGGLQWEYL